MNNVGSTCYPAKKFRSLLGNVKPGNVVSDDNIVTSLGPGTSLEFSLALVEMLYGKEKAEKLAAEMVFQP